MCPLRCYLSGLFTRRVVDDDNITVLCIVSFIIKANNVSTVWILLIRPRNYGCNCAGLLQLHRAVMHIALVSRRELTLMDLSPIGSDHIIFEAFYL
jgi:hypothetical protein